MHCRRRSTTIVLAALSAALIAFAAVPALASAAIEYEVDVTTTSTETSGCEAPGPATECALPGAIVAANEHAGKDTITFDPTVFQGAPPFASIALNSPQAITEEVEILGGHTPGRQCATGWGVEGPCVELTLSGGGTDIFTVDANNVTVEGIAFDAAESGIVVNEGRTSFKAANDWFGVGLERGFTAGLTKDGIRLGPGADGATIGGTVASRRNVFRQGGIGVYVHGASSASIAGNYLGLDPEGNFGLGHSLEEGVRIADDRQTVPFTKAEHDEVGGILSQAEAESASCDGACNVVAVEPGGTDIDLSGRFLQGDEPASGPTTVRANYLGLSPDGTAPIGRADLGVFAGPAGFSGGAPADVTIGGEDAFSEGNYLDAIELVGVDAEAAPGLAVLGNGFGILFDGTITDRAGNISVYAESENLPEGALIAGNAIAPGPTIGIESQFAGSEIVENEIVGGQFGIRAKEDDGGVGNVIEGNVLTESGAAESGAGILVENSSNVIAENSVAESEGIAIEVEGEDQLTQSEANVVIGNTVTAAAEIGILVGSNANHNRVGGDAPGEVNSVDDSGAAEPTNLAFGAITINGRQTGRNVIAANTGSGNVGAFIKLISHGGAEEPNGGIKPPVIATALQSSATGTAQAGAIVRVFSKAKPEAGELGTLLAVVTADSTGAWKAAFAKQPTGTLIVATQTGEVAPVVGPGTSELSTPLAALADPEEEKGGGGTGGGGGSTGTPGGSPVPIAAPAPAPAKAPTVKITSGPKKSSTATTAKFKFKAEPAAGVKFECKLDGAKWAKCASPKTYRKLKPGKHTFQVRASAAGKTGAATKFKFTVKP